MGGMTLPDFTALCPVCHCGTEDICADCGGFQLTPRMAAALWARCQLLGDGAYNDIETHGDNPVDPDEAWTVFSDFPGITWLQTSAWRRQCARAFDDLAGDLEAGYWPQPTLPSRGDGAAPGRPSQPGARRRVARADPNDDAQRSRRRGPGWRDRRAVSGHRHPRTIRPGAGWHRGSEFRRQRLFPDRGLPSTSLVSYLSEHEAPRRAARAQALTTIPTALSPPRRSRADAGIGLRLRSSAAAATRVGLGPTVLQAPHPTVLTCPDSVRRRSIGAHSA